MAVKSVTFVGGGGESEQKNHFHKFVRTSLFLSLAPLELFLPTTASSAVHRAYLSMRHPESRKLASSGTKVFRSPAFEGRSRITKILFPSLAGAVTLRRHLA